MPKDDEVEYIVGIDELDGFNGLNQSDELDELNQLCTLQQVMDSRWSSYFGSASILIKMWSTCVVLLKIINKWAIPSKWEVDLD